METHPRRTVLAAALGAAAATAAAGTAQAHGGGERKFVKRRLKAMSLEEKVGQLFTTYAYGQTADTTAAADVAANRTAHGVDNAAALIEKYHLGGVIYFAWSNNVANPAQITALSNGLQDAALAGCGTPCSSPPTRSTASSPASARPRRSCPGRWPSAPRTTPRPPAPRPSSPGPSCARWA
nr:hypothetical protein GCM10025732_42930 [Glycomyces mayteni]